MATTTSNNDNTGERETWLAFTAGDDGALKTLYDAHFEMLYSFGRKYANDESLAEDAIQDLFLKLLRNRTALAVPGKLAAYLVRAYRNILVDKLRKLDTTRSHELAGTGFTPGFFLENELEEKEEQRLLRDRLQKALAALTPRQREIIYLRYHYNFSYEETAAILGLSEKAAYKLMARAIEALKGAFPALLLFLK